MRISDWSSDVCSSDLATIAEIDTIGAAIAAAVEEQSAATQEISRNVQEAAVGAQQAGSNITGVHSAIGQTSTAADEMQQASGSLEPQARELQAPVNEFLTQVRKSGRASCGERECQSVAITGVHAT